jgi:hypothetical protein
MFVRRHSDEGLQEDNLSEEDGWSEFSVENLRSPVSRLISRRSRDVTMSAAKGSKLRRSRTVDPSHKDC